MNHSIGNHSRSSWLNSHRTNGSRQTWIPFWFASDHVPSRELHGDGNVSPFPPRKVNWNPIPARPRMFFLPTVPIPARPRNIIPHPHPVPAHNFPVPAFPANSNWTFKKPLNYYSRSWIILISTISHGLTGNQTFSTNNSLPLRH